MKEQLDRIEEKLDSLIQIFEEIQRSNKVKVYMVTRVRTDGSIEKIPHSRGAVEAIFGEGAAKAIEERGDVEYWDKSEF